MICHSVKDDHQQVWENLSVSLFPSLTAQQCGEALLPALVFYNLLHACFLLPADSTRNMKLSTSSCGHPVIGHILKPANVDKLYQPDSIICPTDI